MVVVDPKDSSGVPVIEFGKEQALLQDIASRFFREKWPIEEARAHLETESGDDAALWREIVDAGWTGMVVPERYGGLGLGMTELVTVTEPMGRHLFGSAFVVSQLTIQGLLHSGSGEVGEALRATWLEKLAEGAVGSLALVEAGGDWDLENCECKAEDSGTIIRLSGEKRFVLDAPRADVVLISVSHDGAPAIAVVDGGRVNESACAREVVIDETRRSYRLSLDGIEVERSSLITGEDALSALRAIRDAALVLVSAEACGGTAGVLAVIVEYLKSRIQFGRPIGSYQGLKHPTVDVLVGLERARSHLYHSATVFGEPGSETALRMLKVAASDAFAFAGDRAVQFHGAFGFTYECDAQLFLRRALWCQAQFGDALHHRKRLADLLLGAA